MMLSIPFHAFFLVLLHQAYSANPEACTSTNQLACYAASNQFNCEDYARTSSGRVFPSLVSTLTAGKWGPALLQDVYLIEKLQRLNRERIPERVVHAKGTGAFGYFEVTNDISNYTMANFLQPGKITNVAARFSTDVGRAGSADTLVDRKGFAVKFYTEDGIYDFLGLNMPVFGTRDPMMVPDIMHSRKKNPQTNLDDSNPFWDIASERPENMLLGMYFFSRPAYIRSFTFADGFAIHTFKLRRRDNKSIFAKFTFSSDAKDKSYFNHTEALTTAGINPDYLVQDLYDRIAKQNYPTWTLNIQIMTKEQAEHFPYSIFDATKYWNTTQFPLIPVGKLVLNRNPQNSFSDVEQLAFCPANLVPGIEPTPDRILSARMLVYRDAQSYRLGINHNLIPVNSCPFATKNYARDGFMNVGSNGGNSPNYFPNTFHGPTNNNNTYYKELPYEVCGYIDRFDTRNEDNFSQCREYLNSLSDADVNFMLENMAISLITAERRIIQKVIRNIVDPISKDFGRKFRSALNRMQQKMQKY